MVTIKIWIPTWTCCLLISTLLLIGHDLSANSTNKTRFPTSTPPLNDIQVKNRVPVPMKDGTILYADIFRPVKEGRYPVLVCRTPYNLEERSEPAFFAKRGK